VDATVPSTTAPGATRPARRALPGPGVLGRVLDRDVDAVAGSEPRLADRAGRVAAAHLEVLAELADAHGDDDVASASVERGDDTARRARTPLLDERELLEVEDCRARTLAR